MLSKYNYTYLTPCSFDTCDKWYLLVVAITNRDFDNCVTVWMCRELSPIINKYNTKHFQKLVSNLRRGVFVD